MSSIDIEKLAEECQEMLPLLCSYIDDELSTAERERVTSHLEECAFCRLALEEMTEASKSFRALLPLLPPAGIAKEVHAGVADLLSPEEAYAMERSLDAAETPPRQRSTTGKWIGRAAILAVSTIALVLAGTAAVSEFVPPDDEPAPTAIVERETLPESDESDQEPVEDTPAETEQPGEPDDEPQDLSAAGTFVTIDSSAAPALDTTPPPTPTPLSPPNNEIHDADSTVVLTWEAVDDPSGVTYGVDLERYDPDTDSYVAWKTVPGLTEPTLSYHTGDTAERWRIWATDGAGNSSTKTEWWTILKPILIVPGYDIYEPPTLY